MAAAGGGGVGSAAILLKSQFKELSKNPIDGFIVGLVDDNIFEWRVLVTGPPGTLFEGGYFPTILKFPPTYPDKPPTMHFTTKGFFHPNVYPDGKVCISILHEAKEDVFNQQEQMSEKWRPVLGVEAILVSVVSLLSAPNLESPANIDAAVMLKNDPKEYKKAVRAVVRRSEEELG
jgi:ubiquitin-conjugating enzyme E2 G1